MNRRALLSLINIGVAVTTLVVWFRYPQYAQYALYAFFGWFVISLTTIWFARGAPRGPVPSTGSGVGPAAASPAAPGSPAPGAPPHGAAAATGRPLPSRSAPPAQIDFCVYCATGLSPGTPQCPTCGHLRPTLS